MYTSNPPAGKTGHWLFPDNSNRPTSDFQQERDSFRSYVVPAWLHRAFSRNHSLTEIHDYSKLRTVCSLKDVASLIVTNRYLLNEPEVRGLYQGDHLLFDFFNLKDSPSNAVGVPLLTDEEYSEYKASVLAYEQDESFIRSVLARYRAELPSQIACSDFGFFDEPTLRGGGDKTPQEKGYRVEVVNDSLYIIVEEGFLSLIAEKAERLAFLQQVLKAAYAALPISAVNQTVWYRCYVHSLNPECE